MAILFPLEETIRRRASVRTYNNDPVTEETRAAITAYAAGVDNPLGPKPRLGLIDRKTAENGEKLGTYGVIRGAKLFIGAAISGDATAQEALGYELEELVLYMTSLGLGTCWLGGTFNKGAFAKAMELTEGERFPIITPVGYPAEKRSVIERVMRSRIKADHRKPWGELFFDGDFGAPLTEAAAGEYAFPLELMRLAPSAVNGQPWRVVRRGNAFHFYELATMGGGGHDGDMQRIDMGIGLCHFHLAAQERGLAGRFVREAPEGVATPDKAVYIVSWAGE